jgi:hypothetical protein
MITELLHGTNEDLAEALLRLDDLRLKPVTIVVDRPDWSEKDSVGEHASSLLSVVERTTRDLEVLNVHRAGVWNLEENKAEIVRRGMKPGYFLAFRIDQHRL